MPVFCTFQNESLVSRVRTRWVGFAIGKVYVHEKRLLFIPVTVNMTFFSNIGVLPPFSARSEAFALV